jgi:hypothetical protein
MHQKDLGVVGVDLKAYCSMRGLNAKILTTVDCHISTQAASSALWTSDDTLNQDYGPKYAFYNFKNLDDTPVQV